MKQEEKAFEINIEASKHYGNVLITTHLASF